MTPTHQKAPRQRARRVLGGADHVQVGLLPEPLGDGVGEDLVVVDDGNPDRYAGHGQILLVTAPRRHHQPPQRRLRQVEEPGGSTRAAGAAASCPWRRGRS